MDSSNRPLAVIVSALLVLSALGATVSVPAALGSTQAGTLSPGPVDECGTIAQSGNYTLQDDLNRDGQPGTCLRVNASDVVIDGADDSIFNGQGDGVGVRVGGAGPTIRNVTVRNLDVSDLETGLVATGVRNLTIVDSEFDSSDGAGIVLGNATGRSGTVADARIEGSNIEENELGVVLGPGVSRVTIVDNDFVDNRAPGLTVRGATDTTVRDNGFSGTDGGRLISVVGDSTDTLLVENGIRGANSGYGVYVGGTATATTVRNNTVKNNIDGGILLATAGNTVTDNVVRNNGVGISLNGSSNNVLRDNWVYENGDWDYRSADGSTGNTVRNLSLDEENETVVSFDVSRDVALDGVTESNRPEPPEDYTSTGAWVRAEATSPEGYVLLNVSYEDFPEEDITSVMRYDDDEERWFNDTEFTGSDESADLAYAYVTDFSVFTPLYGEGDLRPPVARATASPNPVLVDETVTLDGRNTTDESAITSYFWDVGNDGTVETTGRTATRRFDRPSTRRVALTVRDRADYTDTVVINLTVAEDTERPTADVAEGDRRVYTDATVRFDGSASDDDVGVGTYEWRFGDGDNATGETVTHTFAEPSGTTPDAVNLTVTDRTGKTDTTTVNVTAVDPAADDTAPTAEAGPERHAVLGRAVTLDGSASTDDVAVERYEWDVGNDGTVDATGATPSYTFTETGAVEVALTVTDGGGNEHTDTTTVTVTESDTQPPAAAAGPDRTVRADEVVTFDGAGSTDDSGTVASYRWAMGDGSVRYGEVVEHQYASAGTYTVTLTVTDREGNVAAETATVVVEPDATVGRVDRDDGTGVPPANPTAVRTTYTGDRAADVTVDRARADARFRLGFDLERPADRCHALGALRFGTSRAADSELTVRHPEDGTPAFDVDRAGDAFGYVAVEGTPAAALDGPAAFDVRLARDCLEERGVDPSGVALYRYTGEEWARLNTTRGADLGPDEVRYSARTEGLPLLAIAPEPGDRPEPTPTPTPTPTPGDSTPTATVTPTPGGPTPTATPTADGPTATPTDADSPTTETGGQSGFGVVVALLAVAGAALLARRRRER
jgi:PGF-CTERM protein